MAPKGPKELQNDIGRAVNILELFTDPKKGRDVQKLIPKSILKDAHGIVFIRLYKVGFVLSAKSGTGVIIARLSDGSWSAPSGVSVSSVGFGHQAGGQIIDSVIVMNYRAAVEAFIDGGGQLQLGAGASLAAGPFGRSADVAASASNTKHIAATYSYSASKGLFAGFSFEGSKISERPNTNKGFYGRAITAREILTGHVPPPKDAGKLYDMLMTLGAGPRPDFPFASQGPGNTPLSPTQNVGNAPLVLSEPQTPGQLPPNSEFSQQQPYQYDGPPPPYEQYVPSVQPPEKLSEPDISSASPLETNLIVSGTSGKTTDATIPATPVNTANTTPANVTPINTTPSMYTPINTTPTISSPMNSTLTISTPVNSIPAISSLINAAPTMSPPINTTSSNVVTSPEQLQYNDQSIQDNKTNKINQNSFITDTDAGYNISTSFITVSDIDEKTKMGNAISDFNQPGAISNSESKRPSNNESNMPTTITTTKVKALYDFVANQPTDLSFKAGDIITVTKRVQDRQAWWEGEVEGKTGYFPANYTEEISGSS